MKRAKIKNLPSGVGVNRISNGRTEFWRVRLGKRFTGGESHKKYFATLDEARQWIFGGADEFKAPVGGVVPLKKAAGTAAFNLDPSQLTEAGTAIRQCEKAGLSLTEAIRFAVRHAKPPAGVIPVSRAIAEALAEKAKSKRPSYLADLRKRWQRFQRWLPDEKRRAINGVTSFDVRKFLNGCELKPVGERNMLRNLSVLFSWAVNQHYMAENPCLGITVEESTEKKAAVRILTIEETRKLLNLAATGFKVEAEEEEEDRWRKKFGAISLTVPPMDMVPILVVGCFGGVRPDESVRMTWEMVDFKRKHLDLPAEITKDGNRRLVEMSDNLFEWLLACRKKSGLLLPANFRRKRWALSRAMKWKEWPDDVLRHSYGSYHLAKHRNSGLTAEQMGHQNARMLYRHYREVIKDADSVDEYWALTPKGT